MPVGHLHFFFSLTRFSPYQVLSLDSKLPTWGMKGHAHPRKGQVRARVLCAEAGEGYRNELPAPTGAQGEVSSLCGDAIGQIQDHSVRMKPVLTVLEI